MEGTEMHGTDLQSGAPRTGSRDHGRGRTGHIFWGWWLCVAVVFLALRPWRPGAQGPPWPDDQWGNDMPSTDHILEVAHRPEFLLGFGVSIRGTPGHPRSLSGAPPCWPAWFRTWPSLFPSWPLYVQRANGTNAGSTWIAKTGGLFLPCTGSRAWGLSTLTGHPVPTKATSRVVSLQVELTHTWTHPRGHCRVGQTL